MFPRKLFSPILWVNSQGMIDHLLLSLGGSFTNTSYLSTLLNGYNEHTVAWVEYTDSTEWVDH